MNLSYGKTPIPVLFENDSCIVLDKPSGLSVQGGEGVRVSLDLLLASAITPRPLLVHRLDRDTSGVILVAKNRAAAAGFSLLLAGGESSGRAEKHRTVIKQYLSVCSGPVHGKEGVIALELEEKDKNRTTVMKKSETFFRLLSTGKSGEDTFSLLELELGTGRMHQIRRHLAQTGNPVLGDDKYGDFSLNKKLKKNQGLKNLLLHASRLVIPPSPGLVSEGLDVSAPLPEYFSAFIKLLTLTPTLP